MNIMLKAGFARGEITPPMGINVWGYYEPRTAKGVLDPLLATAVAFDDGEKRAVVMSVDVGGINMEAMAHIRSEVAKAIDTELDGVFIACTHTHLGPGIAPPQSKTASPETLEYSKWFTARLADIAFLAINDLAPVTKRLVTRGEVKDVAFIRRYRMKDGTVRTNPGWQNPDVAHALGSPDEESQLLIIKREGKPEIGIVNFQVHPDVIGGELLSADYPKFVRDTYELNVPDSLCMYINGAQGDSNHIDIRLDPEKECGTGYERARYMGKKIAMSVISNYELAKEIAGEKISYTHKMVTTKYNKGTPDEIPAALELAKRYHELGAEAALPELQDMERTQLIAKACRIERMQSLPDAKELIVGATTEDVFVNALFILYIEVRI
ncbi:MAG: hypothetical protein IJ299_05520 [Oscillospiraceae bacterium]|nr:hypothetical protein [Oscillospiraceae bacterium]